MTNLTSCVAAIALLLLPSTTRRTDPVAMAGAASVTQRVSLPAIGETYPDFRLKDHRGRTVRLSSLQGKLILLEPIGMT